MNNGRGNTGELLDALTEREAAILRLIASGASNQEIADELSLALETVKWYNKRIFSKLGVRNRTEAISRADALNLLKMSLSHLLPRNNLPVQVTSFVGRHQEISDATRLLQTSRLLTLTGPAGSGKTRLAIQVAMAVEVYFEDGVYFVPLASVTGADNVFWAIAEHLGIQFHQQSKPLEQLLNYLNDKHILLIWDNCEHVLDGVSLAGEIIRAAPHVKVLATSRERLSLYGEVNYTIGGLALHVTDEQERILSDSVKLFVQRAMSVDPDLKLEEADLQSVMHICHLVEGMPLGIELAATWVDVLSPKEIANEIEHSLDILTAELRGVSHWHTSIRAAIARSWDLLNPVQQIAFRRVSVFRGGFTRDAVEKIAGVELRTLQALVSKSLLRYLPDSGRYEIHELLRQYAHEQLERSGEAPTVNEAYATYFAEFMAERWQEMKGPRQRVALLEIEADLENIRASWQYWSLVRNVSRLRQFLHGFWVIYDIRGWYPAGIELFEQGAELMRAIGTEEAQATLGWLLAVLGLYNVAGGIYLIVGGLRKAFDLSQQGLHLLEQLHGYDDLMIIPLISLFITACCVNRVDVAVAAAQDCLEIAGKINDRWAIAKAKQFLAIRAIDDGQFEVAARLAQEALRTYEENVDRWSESVLCIEVLSLLAVTLRQYEQGKQWIQRGLKAATEIDYKYSEQMAYWQLGYIATLQENYAEAAAHWHKALEIGEDVIGSPIVIGFSGTGIEWGGRKLIGK